MKEQKHSGMGIASFIISVASGFFLFVMFVAAGVMEASSPGGIDDQSAGAIILGLFLFAFTGTSMVALGLGIAGLIQKDRNKIFAILGTVFSAVTIVGTTSIIVLGLAIG